MPEVRLPPNSAEIVSIAASDGTALPLTVVRGRGESAGLMIFPSAFGVGADLVEQMRELAAEARAVVALDPFFRGDGGFARSAEMPRVLARMQALDRAQAARDLRAAIGWMRGAAGCRAVAVLGICFGGPFALLAAADAACDGVVTWHGTALGQHLARAADMRCPLRLHFGGADPFVPASEIDAVRAAFAGRADVEIAVHAGATHGYSHRAVPEAYHAAAERAGMDGAAALLRALG
jgi:carboxymethylenebutenolidase